jgi:hypothetical protein
VIFGGGGEEAELASFEGVSPDRRESEVRGRFLESFFSGGETAFRACKYVSAAAEDGKAVLSGRAPV